MNDFNPIGALIQSSHFKARVIALDLSTHTIIYCQCPECLSEPFIPGPDWHRQGIEVEDA